MNGMQDYRRQTDRMGATYSNLDIIHLPTGGW